MKTIKEIQSDMWLSKMYSVQQSIRTAIEQGKNELVTGLDSKLEQEAIHAGYDTSYVVLNENYEFIEFNELIENSPVYLKISWHKE